MPIHRTHPSRPSRTALHRALPVGLVAAVALVVGLLPAAGAAPRGGGDRPPSTLTRPLFDHGAKVAGLAEPGWYEDAIPFVDLPEQGRTIEEIYYYRWSVFQKQLRYLGPKASYNTNVFHNGGWMGPNEMRELRWFRHRGPVENNVATGQLAERLRYTDPTADNLEQYALATGRTDLLAKALPDLIDQWHSYDAYYDRKVGLFWHQPVWDATEHTIAGAKVDFTVPKNKQFPNPEDFLLPLDSFFGGYGYTVTLNAAKAADARVIADTARRVGDRRLAARWDRTASGLERRMVDVLWDDDRDFFFHVMKDNAAQGYKDPSGQVYPDLTKLSGREIWGYYPWQFKGVPDQRRFAGAWRSLLDPQGFDTPAGPSTAEARDVDTDLSGGFGRQYVDGNCCRWNGPNWPYTAARSLVALGTFLREYRHQVPPGESRPVVTREDWADELDAYARLQHKDGKPYVAEAADARTGQWIYDGDQRSEHYNAYPFADLVVNGLVGVMPQEGRKLRLQPLVGKDWDHFAAERVPYHGKELTIVWDRTGRHYGVGRGLSVWVDGRLAGHARTLDRPLSVDVGRTTVPDVAPGSASSRFDGSRANWAKSLPASFPQTTASYGGNTTVSDKDPGDANPPVTFTETPGVATDGQVLYDDDLLHAKWSTVGSPNAEDWLASDFGVARTVDEVRVSWYADPKIAAPRSVRLEAWTGGAWRDVPLRARPATPRGDDAQRLVPRSPVRTQKVRIVFPSGERPVGVSELEAWGPTASPTTNCPAAGSQHPGSLHYEAEDGVVNLGGASASAYACGWSVVGGLNTNREFFVDDWSKVKPGDFGDTEAGGLWEGQTGVSFVQLGVTPRRATSTARLRYANGTAETATFRVSVDGRDRGLVRLPPTGGWAAVAGGLDEVSLPLRLSPGKHAVRLSRVDGYAELDALDLG